MNRTFITSSRNNTRVSVDAAVNPDVLSLNQPLLFF